VEKRKAETGSFKEGHQYITPRTLLAIIRVAQGLARLRFNEQVEQIDINEALRLIEASRSSINDDENQTKGFTNQKTDVMSDIFLIVRNVCSSKEDKTVSYKDMERKVLSKGFKLENWNETIEYYSSLGIVYVNSSKSEITLI
jgi:DNA replication licensing factor MCM7